MCVCCNNNVHCSVDLLLQKYKFVHNNHGHFYISLLTGHACALTSDEKVTV